MMGMPQQLIKGKRTLSEVKTFFIPSTGKPIIKNKEVKVPTGETRKGFFGGEKAVTRTEQRQEITGYSDCQIDGEALARRMHEAIDPWLAQGYELFSITPVTSGSYNYYSQQGSINTKFIGTYGYVSGTGSVSYGYGYSYTEGLIVVLKKS